MEQFTQNAKYLEQVAEVYPHAAREASEMPLHSEKTDTDYVVVRARDVHGEVVSDAPTVMYIPGFGEGIDNKVSFAGELAARGFNVVLPEQNREQKVRGRSLFSKAVDFLVTKEKRQQRRSRLGATALQAEIFQDVIDSASSREEINPVSAVVTHSYGSLIANEMVGQNRKAFKDKDMIMLAPAGAIEGVRYPTMIARWVKMLISESDKKRRADIPDHKGHTGQSSIKRLFKRPSRTFAEVGALRHDKVNFTEIAQDVMSLHVVPYANDKMYPGEKMVDMIEEGFHDCEEYDLDKVAGWSTPIDPGHVQGRLYGRGISDEERAQAVYIAPKGRDLRDGAVHDDEQFNPSRVANFIEYALSHRLPKKDVYWLQHVVGFERVDQDGTPRDSDQ